MLNFNEMSQTPSEIRQHKSKLHYLQVLYIFLVFSVGTTEVSFFFSPLPGIAAVGLAYLVRYLNKPIFPTGAWSIFKLTLYLLMVATLDITDW